LNAIPIKFEIGANVIYRLFNVTRILILPSICSTTASSILPTASLPLFGPVNPKQGIKVPSANFGKK
jgi:hypothetical protein